MVQIEWLIARVDSNSGHFVDFVTAPNVLLPIRPRQVHAAKWNQETRPVLPTFSRQTLIEAVHILGQQSLETASPSLDDAMLLELCHQRLGIAVFQSAERPIEKID